MKNMKRIGIAGALALGVGCLSWQLRAQEPAKFATPEEAARALTSIFKVGGRSSMTQIFSAGPLDESNPDLAEQLSTSLLIGANEPPVKTSVTQEQGGDRATVSVRVEAARELPPVLCVKVGEGWKIDSVATARAWAAQDSVAYADLARLVHDIDNNGRMSGEAATKSCQNRLKQLGLGLMQYTQDYDEKMPIATKWADELQPYVKAKQLFSCPSLGQNGYSLNWKLSKKPFAVIEDTSGTVAIYDSRATTRNAAGDGRDIDFRHQKGPGAAGPTGQDGANFLFSDGHVGFFQPGSKSFSFNLSAPKR